MNTLELALNIVVAILLTLTIGYCWVLNRRIRVLQDSRSELAQLIQHFDESTRRASASIITLQTASKKVSEQINERIDRANFMADDLAFLMERSAKISDKLESQISQSRSKPTASAARDPENASAVRKTRPHKAELETLAPVHLPVAAAPVQETPVDERVRARSTAKETLAAIFSSRGKINDASTAANLESALERLAARKPLPSGSEEENPAAAIAASRQREQAEELLSLVRSTKPV